MINRHYLYAVGILALGVATRFLPHPFNFSALGAVMLFTGFWYKDMKIWVVILPLLIAQDWYFGWYETPVMASVYLSYIGIYLLGRIIPKEYGVRHALGASFGSSLLFYFVTNGAVWAFTPYYSHTFNGLLTSYYFALPFWRNSVMGDLVYGILVFEGYAYALPYLRTWMTKNLRTSL